jgi:hypothetical protein
MRLISVVFTFLVSICPVFSQSSQTLPNFSSNISTDTFAVNLYLRTMNRNYDLVNGREYFPYHNVYHTNPFFKSEINATGTVYSNGKTYTGLRISYDIYKDEIILNYLNPAGSVNLIILNNYSIDSFQIVINKEPTTFQPFFFPEDSKIKTGFYEVSYNGKTRLLIKHKKELVEKGGYDEYPYLTQRYLYINEKYFRITTQSRFLKLFGDKSSLIKKYIRSLHISSFRRITDIEIIPILRYYETL